MIRLLLLFLALAGPAATQTARVFSGEHGDCTRLADEFAVPVGWTLGLGTSGHGCAGP